jgi:4-amino-4-deoxy-L-arabinose transferase-like glycosyltransferase
MFKSRVVLIAIFIPLAILHILIVIPAYQSPEVFTEIDSLQYLDLAYGLQSTRSYEGLTIPDIDLMRPPGYPLFLLFSLILGGGSLKLVPIFQLIILLASAGLIFLTGVELGSRKAGVVGSFIYLLNPNAAFWSLMLLTETIAGFWLVLGIWFAVRYWNTGRALWLGLFGAALALGTLTRPIMLPLSLFLAAIIFIIEWVKGRNLRMSFTSLMYFTVSLLLLIIPWQLRNLSVHGHFSLSTVGESTFHNWIVANTLAKIEGITRNEASVMISNSGRSLGYSMEIIRLHPTIFIQDQVRGIMRTFLGAEYATWAMKLGRVQVGNADMISALLERRDLVEFGTAFSEQLRIPWFWAGIYALLFNVIMYVLVGIAVMKAIRRRLPSPVSYFIIFTLILSIVFLLLLPLGAGESRFRAPADPLLGLLAGMAFLDRNTPV